MYLSRPPLRQPSRLFRLSTRNAPLSRSFHPSRPSHAFRTPTTRRKNSPGSKSMLRRPPFESEREYLKLHGTNIWTQAREDRILERTLPKERFLNVAERLFQAAEESEFQVNAAAIQDIGPDTNQTFHIGNIVGPRKGPFPAWHLASCAAAGANHAIYAMCLSTTASQPLPLSFKPAMQIVRTQLDALATQARDPRAMIVRAYLLAHNNQHQEARAQFDEALPLMKPNQRVVSLPNGTRLPPMPQLKSPWPLYASLLDKTDPDPATAREHFLTSIARDYHDPAALVVHAASFLRRDPPDFDAYEEAMSQAASAGNAEACRRLACFYYSTYQGTYPPRGHDSALVPEQDSDRNNSSSSSDWLTKLKTFIQSLRGPLPRSKFRPLAIEWFELAALQGDAKAALSLAVLVREDGDAERGMELLLQSGGVSGFARSLRLNWEREDYRPGIPAELLVC
ncbi:hypothetical protein P168DRAFT_325286 [Aspergillus campestris IBT 28561]|uniref:Uncharacterized protein n=1 Tax=Aspergillus campestris (strain IBT 28561) TaxID=1392248 RepID=A0A2I1D970_ASPC2|nr:uncharacterized protein P168DRAFT_325286 [Aspergillus campestris IBT 28561]PKY06416.1 hypothetical protein P168DRAFT_325286 [Aspergillus campestris IBT 28561]